MIIHDLKIWPEYFEKIKTGLKTFELRKDDRDFRVGDELILREFKDGCYTYNICRRKIIYILRGSPGIKKGYVILGLEKI